MSVVHDIETLKTEVHQLKTDSIILEERLKDIHEDMAELRSQNKQLIEFMYKFQGGKSWLFGLLTVSAAAGSLISGLVGFFFKVH